MIGNPWLKILEIVFSVIPVLDRLDDNPAAAMPAALTLHFPGQQVAPHQAAHEPEL
jgi:hypothetical protein